MGIEPVIKVQFKNVDANDVTEVAELNNPLGIAVNLDPLKAFARVVTELKNTLLVAAVIVVNPEL